MANSDQRCGVVDEIVGQLRQGLLYSSDSFACPLIVDQQASLHMANVPYPTTCMLVHVRTMHLIESAVQPQSSVYH